MRLSHVIFVSPFELGISRKKLRTLVENQTFRMEKQLGQVNKSPSTWVTEEEDKILQICRIYVEVGECLVPLVMTQCTDAQIVSILEVPPTQRILRPQSFGDAFLAWRIDYPS